MGLHGVGLRLVLPALLGYGGYYPYYYRHFPTYGYSAWYNPWTGAYGRSAGVYGPYGGAGVGARYNPRTGTYARGAAAYGPYGARGVAQAYNPRTGTYAQTRQGSNVYGSWGSTSVQRGDDWAKTNRYTNNRTGTTTRTVRTDEGAAISQEGRRRRPRRRRQRRQRLRRQGRQRLSQAGRHVAEVRERRLEHHGQAARRAADAADRPATGTARYGTTGATTRPSTTDRGTIDQLNRDSQARTTGSSRTQGHEHLPRRYRHRTSTGSYRGGGPRAAAVARAAAEAVENHVEAPSRCCVICCRCSRHSLDHPINRLPIAPPRPAG